MTDSSTTTKRPKAPPVAKISPWTWFERIAKVSSFLVIPIALWAVSVQISISNLPNDLALLELGMKAHVERRIDTLPPAAFREKVNKLETLVKENGTRIGGVELSVARIERDMSAVLRILDSD